MKLAVLGGGNGGHAMVADLWSAGFEANFFELPQFEMNTAYTKLRGGMHFTVRTREGKEFTAPAGGHSGFVKKRGKITTDIKEALSDVDIINIVVPGYAQAAFYEKIIPHLEDGQIVISHPGNFGTLELRRMMRERSTKKKVLTAETECLIYATRVVGPAMSQLRKAKREVLLSALPADDTGDVLDKINQVYPQFSPGANVLETSLNNINIIIHPASAICNASQIEKYGAYKCDHFDATPSVGRVIEALDDEKQEVSMAFGLAPIPTKDILIRYYREDLPPERKATDKDTLYQTIVKTIYGNTAPPDLKSRFVSEDVAYGLVPLSELARVVNVPTPTADALIQLASVYNETDYRKSGRDLEKMGLKEMSREEILNHLSLEVP